jgi:outer membrane biosynthesis protein TonB
MPITQIPFQDPVAPEKPTPEQLELYGSVDWETAYKELDSNVPHLLIQLQDDLERSRRREAAWISIIVHLLLFIGLWNAKLIGKYLPWHHAEVVVLNPSKDKDVTFLTLPPDAEKLTRKPKTNVLSDKDRVAMTRHPQLDPKELKKILRTPPPGLPGPSGPPLAQPAPQQQATAQNQAPQQGQQSAQRPKFETNQTAQLQAPPSPNNSFSKYMGSMSPGSAIQQAEQAAAASRGAGGQQGYFGVNNAARGSEAGSLEILSDTLGVDFSPYLERIRLEILRHWYEVLPESVYPPILKKGKLAIEFAILQDGSVAGMRLAATSDDAALDRAAWGGIQGSNPFPPLPDEFTKQGGKYLQLRCIFLYNLNEKDLQ